MNLLAIALLAAAAAGLVIAAVQAALVARHARRRVGAPAQRPGISILKPLCGVDDDLAANLELFATRLDYPSYELVLGVRDERDGAYPVARAAADRWPGRVRVVLQRGAPGLNPKVNQLLTMSAAARHELLVISDSNVQVGPGYLDEIAAHLADPQVGLVTNPTVGVGEERLGALLDNLHMTTGVGAGMIGAKLLADQDFVVGKSMAFRRADLAALGGFDALKDLLAEDYMMGRMVRAAGKRVVVANEPVFNLTRRRGVGEFQKRFERWAVMQRSAVGTLVHAAQVLVNPIPLALAALALSPSPETAAAAAATVALKIAFDGAAAASLRPGGFPFAALLAIPLKDLVILRAWAHGLANDTVNWRGHELRVTEGTRLVPVDAAAMATLLVPARDRAA